MTQEVKIIAVTQPLNGFADKPEEFIAYCARVSNPKNQHNNDTAGNLIRYLIKNKHWSPLEMVNVVMSIKTSRDIARQILRHRSFSFQEFSQRYAEVDTSSSFMLRDARLQDSTNRQNSIETADSALRANWMIKQAELQNAVRDVYNWAIENGIAKEQARVVLPEGNTASFLYMNGTLRSWCHYCDLRMGNGTQKEHQEVAEMAWQELGQFFPNITRAIEEING